MDQDEAARQKKIPESSYIMAAAGAHDELHPPVNTQSNRKRAMRQFLYACLALLLWLATLFYSFILPQTPGRLARASVSLIAELPLWSFVVSLPIPVPHTSQLTAGALVVVTVIAFGAYGLAAFISWNRMASRGIVAFIALSSCLFFLLSALSLPNTSTDIFNYIVNGRIAAVHNSNPYFVTADEFPDDPVYPYASKNYTGLSADKLPIWMLANTLLASLTGNDVTTNLLIYRLALMLFNMANLALTGIIANKLNPRYVASALVIYGWNPIVIIHAQSKSDTLMALLLLLAVLFLIKEWRLIAVGAMALSVLVKLFTLPLLVVYELRSLRLRQWRALIVDILIFGTALLFLLVLLWQSSELVMRFVALFGVAGAAAPGAFRIVLIVGFCLLILAVSTVQDGSTQKLLWGWALVMLYFALFLTKFGLAWYLITPIAIASLVFDWRIVLMTGALSFTSFLFNAWYSTFTKAFSPPELSSIPPYLVFILMTGVIAAGSLLFVIGLQKLRQWKSDPSSS